MKRNSAILIILVIFFVSCSSLDYTKVNVTVPIKTVFDIDQFKEIIVTDFYIKKEAEDFDINQELVDYLSNEIKQSFKGTVTSRKTPLEKEELIQDISFWQNLLPAAEDTAIVTGVVEYNQEVRKAILETKKKGSEATFRRDQAIEERRFYTLNLDLYIIDTKTGELAFSTSFKESQGYENPNQTGPFAFFDLIERVKNKFLGSILGGVRAQQRYLIRD